MYLSVDNQVGVQPTTTSSTTLQAQQIDVYADTINFHRITSNSTTPLKTITIPNLSGTLALTTGNQTVSNKMNHAQVGSAADPSYSFIGDLDSGFFSSGANTIGISTNGVSRVTIDTSNINSTIPILAADGIFNLPSYSFTNSPSTGMYYPGANRIGLVASGQPVATLSSTNFLMNKVLYLQDGTNSAPSLSFNSDTNSGIYSSGNDIMTVTIGAANHSRFSTSGFQVFHTNGVRTVDGSVTSGGFNFSSEQGLGIYRDGVNDMRLIAAGTQSLGVESQGIKLYGSVAGANALYSASKLGYYEETTTALGSFTWGTDTQTSNYRLTRIGNICFIIFHDDMSFGSPGGVATAINFTTGIPSRFRPFVPTITSPVLVFDNASGSQQYWFVQLGTNGSMSFSRPIGGVNNTCIMYRCTLSWLI